MTQSLASRVSEISTRIGALCLTGALAGCAGGYGTATSRSPITDAVNGLLNGGSSTPVITTLPNAPVQSRPGTGGYPYVPAPTGTPAELNPTLAYVFDAHAAKKGKQVNFQAACGQYLANAANGIQGPDPLTNPHNVGSLQNQGQGVVQGLLNQATGNRGNVANRTLHNLGTTGLQISSTAAAQWSKACNKAAELNVRAWQTDAAYPADSQPYAVQWNRIASEAYLPVQLALGTEAGGQVMSRGAVNRGIWDLGRTGLQHAYPVNRGVVPDAITRALK